MKQLTCEMCGSTDLIKQGGVFVCQACGCKYSVEEAKKMMIEGTVDVSGSTVKVDNSDLIENYFQMAQNALDSGNNAEAENYSNKIIEIDPQSYRAWFIKGKSAGWQTTGRNNRYPESVADWINAFRFAPDSKKNDLSEVIQSEVVKISLAILQMKIESFTNYRSNENKDDVINVLSMIQNQLGELKIKTAIDVYSDDFKTLLARAIDTGIGKAEVATINDFGTDKRQQNKFNWDKFTRESDCCLNIVQAGYDLSCDDDLSCSFCKLYVIIAESVRDSCSYKYVPNAYGEGKYITEWAFVDTEKERRTKIINEWKQKMNSHDPDIRKKNFISIIEACKNTTDTLEISSAISSYWEQHAAEKTSYENEKENILKQITQLRADKTVNPLYERQKKIYSDIGTWNSQIKTLGLFKGKEKKVLQDKIDAAQVELNSVNAKVQEAEAKYDAELKSLEIRVTEINRLLNMARGRKPIVHGVTPKIFAIGEQNLSMSPAEMLEYFKHKIPKPYCTNSETDKDIINFSKKSIDAVNSMKKIMALINGNPINGNTDDDKWIDDPNAIKTYQIEFCHGTNRSNTSFLCDAKSTKSPIIENLRFELNAGERNTGFMLNDAVDFVIIVSSVLFDMFPSTDMMSLQRTLAAGIYGIDNIKEYVSDGLRIEYKRQKSVVTVTVALE